jgi:hypothetical protein
MPIDVSVGRSMPGLSKQYNAGNTLALTRTAFIL